MEQGTKKAAKAWHLLPHDPAAIERLGRALGVSPIVAQLLLNRELCDPDAAKRFLTCPLPGLHEPERLPGMSAAVERLWLAVKEQRRICVYGDYDVDGVTATATLSTALKHLGAVVDFHVPHRLEDGYGLSIETLQPLPGSGVPTVVTTDPRIPP